MGRFTSWCQGQAPTLAWPGVKKSDFLVVNSRVDVEHHGECKGVRFCSTPSLGDHSEDCEFALFGSVVRGSIISDGWLKVGDRFLPMQVDGMPVLQPFPPTPGTGDLYEVVFDKALIRLTPEADGRLEGFRTKGQIVELFTFDSTRAWRQLYDDASEQLGWMLLAHPSFGALLQPISHIALAVRQNNLVDLKRLIAEGQDVNELTHAGVSPLMVAAQSGFLECCVLLFEAGADGSHAPEVANSNSTRAFVQALSGMDFSLADYEESLSLLPEDVQALADSLFDQAAKAQDARRKAEAEEAKRKADEEEAMLLEARRKADWDIQKLLDARRDADEMLARLLEAKRRVNDAEGADPSPEIPIGSSEHSVSADVSSLRPPARGDLYEVVPKKVFIRETPGGSDGSIVTMRFQGQIVELFDYDPTGSWRRVVTGEGQPGAQPAEPEGDGWMLLHRADIGVLLKPVASAKVD